MPTDLMNEALCDYVGSYIWIMMNDLGSRLEKYLADTQKAYQIEQEFKDMIIAVTLQNSCHRSCKSRIVQRVCIKNLG